MSKVVKIAERELLTYRAEFRNSLFRQIHRRLRQLKEKGFKQKTMAVLLDMDEGQLSRLLRGESSLRLETLSDLARALDCRVRPVLSPLEPYSEKVHIQRTDYSDDNDDVVIAEKAISSPVPSVVHA